LQGEVSSILDLNADGFLDLVGVSGGRATRWLGKGMAGYHWKVIRPRAQQQAGDQRINSFGVGGEIQVRSGLLVQTTLSEQLRLLEGVFEAVAAWLRPTR
jgi:hypothetical protein